MHLHCVLQEGGTLKLNFFHFHELFFKHLSNLHSYRSTNLLIFCVDLEMMKLHSNVFRLLTVYIFVSFVDCIHYSCMFVYVSQKVGVYSDTLVPSVHRLYCPYWIYNKTGLKLEYEHQVSSTAS